MLLIVLLGVVSVLGVGRLFQVREDFEDTNARYFRLEIESEKIRSAFVLEQAALAAAQSAHDQPSQARAYKRARQASVSSQRTARLWAADDAAVQRLLDRRVAAEVAWEQGVAKPLLAGKPSPAAKQLRLTRQVAQTGTALTS